MKKWFQIVLQIKFEQLCVWHKMLNYFNNKLIDFSLFDLYYYIYWINAEYIIHFLILQINIAFLFYLPYKRTLKLVYNWNIIDRPTKVSFTAKNDSDAITFLKDKIISISLTKRISVLYINQWKNKIESYKHL